MKQDVIDSIGAVRREVRACERDGRPARAVIAERTYDTTVKDVWDAITSRERIPRWLAPIEGDLRLGGRYQLQGNAGGEITTCDPPSRLAVTWEFGGGVSWLDVQVSEDPAGALLRLEHVALEEDLEAMVEHMGSFGPGAAGVGWDLSLLGLAEHLRTGEALDIDPQAVPTGDEAEFIARSAEAWGEADIAFGTPEAEARAAAERTAAFYTGGGDLGHGDVPPAGEDPPAG